MTPSPAASELRAAINSLREYFARAVLFSVFTNLLVLAPTLYMLEVYGRVVNSRNTETLVMLTVLVIGLYVVMEFLDWVRQKLMDAAGVQLDHRLGERVFNATFDARLRNLPANELANTVMVVKLEFDSLPETFTTQPAGGKTDVLQR